MRTEDNRCDFCGERFQHHLRAGEDKRYCYECNTDPFRKMVINIIAQIGMPHHIVREIEKLQGEIGTLKAKLTALSGIERRVE